MKTMSFAEFAASRAETLTAVVDDSEEVIITRPGKEPVVIVSLAEYQSLKETMYLVGSGANARRLLGAIDRLENGAGIGHDLLP